MEPEQRPEAAARTVYDRNVAQGYAKQDYGDHYAGPVNQLSFCHFNVTYIDECFMGTASTALQDVAKVQKSPASGLGPPRARSRLSLVRDAVPRPVEERVPEIPALASKEIDEAELSSARLYKVPSARTRRLFLSRDDSASQPAPNVEPGELSLALATAEARRAGSISKTKMAVRGTLASAYIVPDMPTHGRAYPVKDTYDVKVQMKGHWSVVKGDVVEVYGKRGKSWLVKLGYAYGIVPTSAFEIDLLDSVW
ncbi:hypothetical protein AC579_192 [Pseudocercospora musae]|uniref:Uncharacterized protein n=1 Tax=Pseudocercospora musae TaxID=113226 RepID=A0A139HYH3_9PEZI|nr:hypothetical protein AC579_192 [Pseudocercospora musae]